MGKWKGKALVKVIGNEAFMQVRNNLYIIHFKGKPFIISRHTQKNMIKSVIWKENYRWQDVERQLLGGKIS